MILLDTNVISEAMKPAPDDTVRAWLDEQAAETLYLSSVTIAELLFGIGALPAGKRKDRLTEALDGVMELFADRVLPFDVAGARHYADLAVKARADGKGFPTPDGYIAAIAASRGFTVATRDTSAFHAAGVVVINPWNVNS
ncbi:MAG: VapC toxin family PIN domain ribonuclease [Rhizobiales bacterium 24-66-13]|jgi:predicted nucleic acid-binding protein|nr:MAG: VapC toxin family PIN domain ribonuclease [Rhizobiales bacterium 35-66-30]OYZ66748.1 MAG: VapC toxin family PIN domain ribonuclease [Rhizobiales bacterium 24-66-13]OZA92636.1 MAG: VapC toxin family PIN domain ribonuclease [Rhizobiales bacterium 39-66-18]HQS49248.1 type II toxin-antitoxin system VapC family toxin [Xanthobacteraceae bacterium]